MNGLVFYFLLASLPFLQSCFVPLAECWILKQFENCYILFDIRSLVKENSSFQLSIQVGVLYAIGRITSTLINRLCSTKLGPTSKVNLNEIP